MLVQVITLFGEMFSAITEYGVTGRAAKNGLWQLETINPRQFADNRLGYIDDRPFGGGAGMVMQAPPIQAALNVAFEKSGTKKAIYLSPQGVPLTHEKTLELSKQNHLILLCGRYEGIDERILQENDIEEIAIGDFVVSGGELPAMMLIDAVLRHRPNVLGDEQSAQQDSFCSGLLDYPHYTRPVEFNGQKVPDVLLTGNHQEIAKWRHTQSLIRTKKRRPDLWARHCLTPQEVQLLSEHEKSNEQSILD